MSNKVTKTTLESHITLTEFTLPINDTLTLHFTDKLTLSQAEEIAEVIANTCVTEPTYHATFKKPLLLYFILTKLGNVTIPTSNGSINLDYVFKLYKSEIGQKVMSKLDEIPLAQYIAEAVEEKIIFTREKLKIDQRICAFIQTITHLLGDLDIDRINSSANDIFDKFNALEPEKKQELEQIIELKQESE